MASTVLSYWAQKDTEILTYLLTPWCRVLPEQLTGLQLVEKFPAFHGTEILWNFNCFPPLTTNKMFMDIYVS